MMRPVRVLIAAPDAGARAQLRAALTSLAPRLPSRVVGEAEDGVAALDNLAEETVDVLVLDADMPRMDGLELARHLAGREGRPAMVFVITPEPARLTHFATLGLDVLTWPVEPPRLLSALIHARKLSAETGEALRELQPRARRYLSCVERGKIKLIAVEDITYLRAELKYVTARTARREYLLDASLTQLEQEFQNRFLRVHRNCLVARQWIAGFERAHDAQGEAHWMVRIQGLNEKLPVSRRQWPLVRAVAV